MRSFASLSTIVSNFGLILGISLAMWLTILLHRLYSQQQLLTSSVQQILDKGPSAQTSESSTIRIGVFVTALGNYIEFTHQLVQTGRKYFLVAHPTAGVDTLTFGLRFEVVWFIFTNRLSDGPKGNDVRLIHQERLGWPHDSMLRPEIYFNYSSTLAENFDFFYSIDADNKFDDKVGVEFLGDLVGVMHWYHFDKPFDKMAFETKENTCAYVPRKPGNIYYSGAVYGGRKQRVMALWHWMAGCTRQFIEQKLEPDVHDESVLNRYFYSTTPTVILNPSYYNAHKGYGYWPGKRRIVFIDKNYDKARATEKP